MKIFRIFCFLCIFSFSSTFVFCEPAESHAENTETARWVKDLRRTEIITFGSLPFVGLWTTVGYGLAVHGTFHNPLNKSTSRYTQTEQKEIFAISAAVSIGLGLTDLAINLITRNLKKSRQDRMEKTIMVIPFSQQIKDFPPPQEPDDEEILREKDEKQKKEYLIGGLEDDVF